MSRGSSVPVVTVERAVQKTLLSSRVWLAARSFPFGAGNYLQSLTVMKDGRFRIETRVCLVCSCRWSLGFGVR